MTFEEMQNKKKRVKEAGGLNKRLELHNQFLQKIPTRAISYWLRKPTCLIQADFLLVA